MPMHSIYGRELALEILTHIFGAIQKIQKRFSPINSAEELDQEIDQIRQSIVVDRAALIKIWLHERVQKEKSGIP